MDFAFFCYCQQPVWEDLARAELWGGVSEVSLSSLKLPRGVGDPAGMSVTGPAFFKSVIGCLGVLKIPAGWRKRLLMEQGTRCKNRRLLRGWGSAVRARFIAAFYSLSACSYALPR